MVEGQREEKRDSIFYYITIIFTYLLLVWSVKDLSGMR